MYKQLSNFIIFNVKILNMENFVPNNGKLNPYVNIFLLDNCPNGPNFLLLLTISLNSLCRSRCDLPEKLIPCYYEKF